MKILETKTVFFNEPNYHQTFINIIRFYNLIDLKGVFDDK